VRAQLGDAAVREAIDRALARGEADDGNAPVNADIRADAALYEDGTGGRFERSVYIDPGRSSASKGIVDVPPEQQLATVRPPKPGTTGHADSLPVAYEVAAVGSRLQNMARVGGQRVLEMDHFVESVSTPIVRLTLPGEAQPGGSREAVIAARKVLERKLLERSHGAPTIALSGGAPPLRVLTALGEDGVAAAPPHVRVYGELFWSVLVEVVERVLQRRTQDVVGGLYYMPTIRADVFVCSALAAPGTSQDALLHFNVLAFQQSLSCDCDDDDVTRPRSIRAAKWRLLLPYWLCRITAALNESRPGSAHGIYDERTRRRLAARIQERSGSKAGDTAAPMHVQPQAWTPPPVPTAVLTRE